MIQNAWLMPRIYPGWECHVWVGDDITLTLAQILLDLGCTLHTMGRGWKQRMFYRFLIHDEPGVERYLIRDADSRISAREARCVEEWIASGKACHSIHDHPYHIRPLQGGMFGIWRSALNWPGNRTMHERIAAWANDDRWGRDEEFLHAEIWPLVRGSCFEHGHEHPIVERDPNDPGAFIGEIYDANGRPAHPEHRAMRK